jgi:excisionase family DNA binding protein
MRAMENLTRPTQQRTRRGWETEQTPLLCSKRDAATTLSVCVRTIEHLIAAKQLPCRRIGKRILIPYDDLVNFAHYNRLDIGA